MIKSVRNVLGTNEILYEGEEEIKWQYFEDLVSHSGNHSYGLTHKMTKRHIQFADRKMHVRTAVETLSDSTADSIDFLMKQKIRNFHGAGPTIKLIRMFNKYGMS